MFVTDYWRATNFFEKPVFAICTVGVDDGGLGTYKVLGYSMEIKGDFMPEEEFPGATHVVFSLLGKEIKEVNRD
ncbi:MAG: hypothetical protein PHQ49_02695 [Clostridia bacterium]|nr:hypothetical protein [Clostridia bacterium]